MAGATLAPKGVPTAAREVDELMKAIVVKSEEKGNPLSWEDVPPLAIGPQQVLVDVFATALNRADLAQRAGLYPPPPGESEILGLEAAGKVAALGADVTGWSVGDRVCALLPGGGYAEQVVVPEEMLMRIPPNWSFEEAAALPEAYITAYLNLFEEAQLSAGETVLIHAGASGVGMAATQLALAADARVISTVGSDAKVEDCEALGAMRAINYRTSYILEQVMEATDGTGVDVIFDMVGGPRLQDNLKLLRRGGRLVFVSPIGGATGELDILAVMGKRLKLMGSTLRSRTTSEKATLGKQLMDRFGSALGDRRIVPVIDSVFPVQDFEAAHERMEKNLNRGKIVVTIR